MNVKDVAIIIVFAIAYRLTHETHTAFTFIRNLSKQGVLVTLNINN